MDESVRKLYKYFIKYYGRTHAYRNGGDMLVDFDYPSCRSHVEESELGSRVVPCPFTLGIRATSYGIVVWSVNKEFMVHYGHP